ncbi:ATP-binding protein [Limibacter armeniacum]|uniref:ATP-binding protein n=1 Tax=Limibacter armeniacum TaxID=466084 RepID=UPI002FE5A296
MEQVMEYTTEEKQQIIDLLQYKREQSSLGSDAKFAVSIGLNKGVYSQLKNGRYTNKGGKSLLSHQNWVRIARFVGYSHHSELSWKTARTQVFSVISAQLTFCQQHSTTGIFCDIAGIGKSHAGKAYAEQNTNAFYLNCGEAPKKSGFIKLLARTLGFEQAGSLEQLFMDCVYYLKTLTNPIVILDEAGDLEQSAVLLLKRLYNELEFACGLYMLGAEGLRKKMDTGVRLRKNGYEEIFSRFGGKYTRLIPEGHERLKFMRAMARDIVEAQGIKNQEAIKNILTISAGFDMRRIRKEVMKVQLEERLNSN